MRGKTKGREGRQREEREEGKKEGGIKFDVLVFKSV